MIKGLLLLAFFASSAFALPKITTENINGFLVDFVDIGAGDTFATSFSVPLGTMHEYDGLLGRMHLLEHVAHVGTKKFPGYHTFNNTLKRAGVESNASTSPNQTFFFATANAAMAELALQVHLSMLGGLEWNEDTIQKETEVVINEVVEEYMPQEGIALQELPYVKLLAHGHQWSVPSLGDRKTLSKLSLTDLKELYYANYTPEFVRVAIIGNFSDPKFLSDVRGWTRKYLIPANGSQDEKPFWPRSYPLAKRRVPSMFSANHNAPESERRIYIHTKENSTNGISLEAPASSLPKNQEALDVLVEYLAMAGPGSLKHRLQTELGWVTGCGIYNYSVNNRTFLKFSCMLTENGRGHEVEINEMFFSALRSVEAYPPEQKMIDLQISNGLRSFDMSSNSVHTFVGAYRGIMKGKRPLDKVLEDFKAVTVRDIQVAARAFRPDQGLYFSSGPEVEEMEMDEWGYKRKFKLEDNRAALSRYMKIYHTNVPALENETPIFKVAPVLKEVDLGEPTKIKAPAMIQSKPGTPAADKLYVDLRQDLPDVAAVVDFEFMPRSIEDLVASDIVGIAFEEHFAGELEYLDQRYLAKVNGGRTQNVLSMTMRGDSPISVRGLTWKIEQFAKFEPTEEELRRSRERYVNSRKAKYNGDFSARVVVDTMRAWRDPAEVSHLAGAAAASKMDATEILQRWNSLRLKSNIKLYAVGAMDPSDIDALRASTKLLSPFGLTHDENRRLQTRFAPVENGQHKVTANFPARKGDDSYALLRAYQGPPTTDIKESMAFLALDSILGTAIGNYNRGDQKLGYIHQSGASYPNGVNWVMQFIGGTEGAENAKLTEDGWMHVLENFRSGQITDQDIQDAISDIYNSKTQRKTSAAEQIARYKAGVNSAGDARINRKEVEALASLTPQDVREVAAKYILAPGVPFHQLTLNNCEEALTVQ